MSIRQRNGIWWVDLRTPSGERVRRTTGTTEKRAAQEYHDRLKAELWRVAKLGEQPLHTFEQAAVRFLKASEGQRDYKTKVRHVRYWRTQFAGHAICSLTTERIMDALPTHAVFKYQGRVALTPATRNRYLSTIRRMLNLCVEWRWIGSAPSMRPAKEPTVRIRWITQEQAQQLLVSINRDWLRDAAAFALATGVRAGELLSLEWSGVDQERGVAWVTADRAKSGKARAVPLNVEAQAIIKRREGTHPQFVFTRNGRPQTQIDPKMFGRACTRAGITEFRFHDLRHTWASWHVQAGTPLFVLKELGGWETLEMVKRYAHMDAGHLAQFAGAVTFWSHDAAETKIATLQSGDNVLINNDNAGGASLIRTGDLRIMIPTNYKVA